jgi:3-hydroxyisobutyrate dehydrogenase-like beta-hydroxyacid dehydrogenase
MNIGIIGCGLIGSRVGRNWMAAGHAVAGWNRTPEHARDAGFPMLDSPAALAARSDVILIVVADPPALEAVVEGPIGIIRSPLAGKVVLNASTVGPADNQRAAAAVRQAGGEFLEIPFTGSKASAEAAKLVFYVGGEPELFARMEPLLLQAGQKCFHFGPVGAAADAKLIMNLMLASQMEAMAEGFVLAQKAGLETATFIDAYKMNAGYSVLAGMKLGTMLAGDYSTHFALKHMDKDVRLALERARQLQAAAPLAERLKEIYAEGMAAGWGDEDFSVLYRLVSEKSETSVP